MPNSAETAFPMRALLAGARRKERSLLDFTRKLVQAESPSDSKSAVDACVALTAAHLKQLGGRIKIHKQTHHGNALEVRFSPRSSDKAAVQPILLLGHLDTVWPLGTLQSMPCRIRNGRLWGPGTLDMKAGVAMAATALELLMEAGLLRREIILLLNGDEEIGSPASRPITENLARPCSAVYVLEPAQGLAYKTERKGIGDWHIHVKGVAAHAGVDFEKGANALLELARIIETVSGWTDRKRGLTVSVGVAAGGSKSNVVPAHAQADIDVRIPRLADGPRIARKFAALRPANPRCTLTVTGGINRPPMERSRGTARLFSKAHALARDLGFELSEASTGGGSDGNFTAALGIPTLDGMGAVGEGAHASHESVLVEHLAPRTALLAAMLIGYSGSRIAAF
ncbi:MAG: M20 family metallopeptidase [Terracidiphilus sp.]|jgi:glutamate carboxypeptidase